MNVRLTLAIVALSLLAVGVVHVVAAAQTIRDVDQRLYQVERDIQRAADKSESLTGRVAALEALRLEYRLTRLETISESNRTLLLGIAGAVALQVLDMALRMVRRRQAGEWREGEN